MPTSLIPGKIFLALPDTEQSVVAGVFKANTSLAGARCRVGPAESPAADAPPPAAR